MIKLIRYLSKKPRVTGTKWNRECARFLMEKLIDLGYDIILQDISFIGWENVEKPKLKINGKKIKVLPLIWSGSGKVKGKLKFVGKFKTFEAYEWFRWTIADDKKVKGYILSRPDIVWMQLVDKKSKLLYFMVYPDVCKKLKEGKEFFVEGSVKNRFIKNLTLQNIITKNNKKNRILIVAHYDSMINAPGANDNASGVVALLELARRLKDKRVQFILFDAEEWNKSGSYAYVKSLNKNELKKIKAIINIDMIGAGIPFIICSKKFNSTIKKSLKKLKYKKIKIGNDIRAPFDYWPFYKKGKGIIHFGAAPYKYCHDPKDTIDKISLKPIKQIIKIIENIVKEL